MKLYKIAHSRTGDKGNISTISVIAYREEDYPILYEKLTASIVQKWFKSIGAYDVKRFEIPSLGALNFVLYGTLGGSVTRSLALDAHGKTLSGYMLEIEI